MKEDLKQQILRYMKWFMIAYALLPIANVVLSVFQTGFNVMLALVSLLLSAAIAALFEFLLFKRYKKFVQDTILQLGLYKFFTFIACYYFVVSLVLTMLNGQFTVTTILVLPLAVVGVLLWRSANKYKKIQLGLIQDTDLENKETGL